MLSLDWQFGGTLRFVEFDSDLHEVEGEFYGRVCSGCFLFVDQIESGRTVGCGGVDVGPPFNKQADKGLVALKSCIDECCAAL